MLEPLRIRVRTFRLVTLEFCHFRSTQTDLGNDDHYNNNNNIDNDDK